MGTLSRSRRILITGASRGIGRATAVRLAAAGHRVVVAARSVSALEELAAQISKDGGCCEVATLDLTDERSVDECAIAVLAGGPLDVLVNNAGSLDQDLFLSQTVDTRRAEMELNYFGAQRMTRALLPTFIQARSGLIVNVSSMLGTVGTPTTANYCGTKAALEGFSQGLRGELCSAGIKVTVFVAPHTDTELGARAEFKGPRVLSADYVARELVRAIDKAPRRYAASGYLSVGLRLAAWFPDFMESKLRKMVQHSFT